MGVPARHRAGRWAAAAGGSASFPGAVYWPVRRHGELAKLTRDTDRAGGAATGGGFLHIGRAECAGPQHVSAFGDSAGVVRNSGAFAGGQRVLTGRAILLN